MDIKDTESAAALLSGTLLSGFCVEVLDPDPRNDRCFAHLTRRNAQVLCDELEMRGFNTVLTEHRPDGTLVYHRPEPLRGARLETGGTVIGRTKG